MRTSQRNQPADIVNIFFERVTPIPIQLVDAVTGLIAVFHSLLRPEKFLSAMNERHPLGKQDNRGSQPLPASLSAVSFLRERKAYFIPKGVIVV